MPDLLVIDGGKGQLSAALDAKNMFENLEMNIVSLAKARTQKLLLMSKLLVFVAKRYLFQAEKTRYT